MAEPKVNELMEKIVSLCKRRGFIFQSSEIYGGINGFWDYGPLGAELKRNVKEYWWRCLTQQRDDIVGLDASIIMHPKIWEASGHTTTFSDPMVDCLGCKKRFRADQIEALTGAAYHYKGAGGLVTEILLRIKKAMEETKQSEVEQKLFPEYVAISSRESVKPAENPLMLVADLDQRIEQSMTCHDAYSVLFPEDKHPDYARNNARHHYQRRMPASVVPVGERSEKLVNTIRYCNECGSLLTEPRQFNLMFKTYVGPVESEDSVAFLRPETAQAIFAQFKSVLETARQKVPFGVAQIGKAFRNEINPRNFTFRSREFEQMELEFFIKPDEIVEKIAGSVVKFSEGMDLSNPQPNWGWEVWHRYWVDQRLKWYHSIGLPATSLGCHWQSREKNELAHYAKACVDIQFNFPIGFKELEGIHS
ncbi:MAG: glycine--tRNA ligase, partial [Verrucomicrobiota bacterium]